ncbi:MAG: response regulator [Pseudomonadales bacterium]|nr:response regulator [Pseudomonadales bacterium]
MRNISESKIRILHIGLSERDITFIQNLFRLGTKQFRDYELVKYEEQTNAHMVIVNGDNPYSLNKWRQLKSSATTILISKNKPMLSNQIHVLRPLVLRKLVEAFTEAELRTQHLNADRTQVLVADDSLPVRRFMELKLPLMTDVPIAIDYAEDGISAQQKALNKLYDIIFLDVIMPGLDGYQVCKSIKDHSDSFTVMLTSNKSPFDRVRGGMSGCDAFLTKPPKDEQLRKVFQKMIDKSHKQHSTTNLQSSQR